jgi:hypothetical protein
MTAVVPTYRCGGSPGLTPGSLLRRPPSHRPKGQTIRDSSISSGNAPGRPTRGEIRMAYTRARWTGQRPPHCVKRQGPGHSSLSSRGLPKAGGAAAQLDREPGRTVGAGRLHPRRARHPCQDRRCEVEERVAASIAFGGLASRLVSPQLARSCTRLQRGSTTHILPAEPKGVCSALTEGAPNSHSGRYPPAACGPPHYFSPGWRAAQP